MRVVRHVTDLPDALVVVIDRPSVRPGHPAINQRASRKKREAPPRDRISSSIPSHLYPFWGGSLIIAALTISIGLRGVETEKKTGTSALQRPTWRAIRHPNLAPTDSIKKHSVCCNIWWR